MRGIFLTGLVTSLVTGVAVTSFVLSGLSACPAAAASVVSSDDGPAIVQQVANVCGANGCVRVQTQRVHHQKPGSVPAKHI
jgi:hypothetical protein